MARRRYSLINSLVAYPQKDYSTAKPAGIWYSVNNSWEDWCQDNEPGWLTDSRFRLDVTTSKLLTVGLSMRFDEFNDSYGEVAHGRRMINWKSVAEKYDGIEIPMYHWSFRMDPEYYWYYGWDCASGCVWNTKAINRVESIDLYRRES